eukprot:s1696_g7.t2
MALLQVGVRKGSGVALIQLKTKIPSNLGSGGRAHDQLCVSWMCWNCLGLWTGCPDVPTGFQVVKPVEGNASSDVLDECMTARMLRLGRTAAATALAVQICIFERAGKGSKVLEKNEDKSLVFREEEGKTLLVPLHPKSSSKELKKFTVEEVAKHTSRDSLWIIVDNMVYDATRHPGLEVVFFAGRILLRNGGGEVHQAGYKPLALIAPGGHILDPADRLYGLQNEDSLTAVALQPKIAATCRAFALWVVGGDKIVTWGHPDYGGNSSKVHDQLRSVQQVCGTEGAFAAVLADGTVVTWGHPDYGSDSSRVQDQLKNVQQICATYFAFAAILADGSVVTWGRADFGGDSSRVQDQLKNVQQICATYFAFAAILADGTVVTWGSPDGGGDSSRVQDQLKNVQQICGAGCAFAAILADGNVVTWGDPNHGADSSRVQDQLKNVERIGSARVGFLAYLADGTVVTWGRKGFAIAAHLGFLTWGGPNCVCDNSRVQHLLPNVLNGKQIKQNCVTTSASAGAVILEDGNVVTYGDPTSGGDSSRVQDRLRNVLKIYATQHAFAAILADGTVVTWGNPEWGGDSSRVQDQYIDKHPGGPLMLENMAGKDCTDAFANYHSARVYKQLLPPMLIGEATNVTVPPHVQDFREVRQELLRRGLFETDMRFYAKMAAWLISLFLLSLYLSTGCTSTTSHMLGAAVPWMPASRASTLLGSTPLTKQAMAEKAINQEEKFGSLKDMSPEEKEAQFDSWLEKYAPDGPYMKEMTELEKEIVQTYPSYDAEAAIKNHAEFADYFCDVVEFMRDEHERSQELKELFKRFDALNGDEEELKAKKAKWAGSRADKLAKLAALRAA